MSPTSALLCGLVLSIVGVVSFIRAVLLSRRLKGSYVSAPGVVERCVSRGGSGWAGGSEFTSFASFIYRYTVDGSTHLGTAFGKARAGDPIVVLVHRDDPTRSIPASRWNGEGVPFLLRLLGLFLTGFGVCLVIAGCIDG